MFSTTGGDGATSVDQCHCFTGTDRRGSACVVGQLYALPAVWQCPFCTYASGVLELCTSCRVAPYPTCGNGLYPLSNGSCLPCVGPTMAEFTTPGLSPGVDTSCAYECLLCFYFLPNVSLAVRRTQPGFNTYHPKRCDLARFCRCNASRARTPRRRRTTRLCPHTTPSAAR